MSSKVANSVRREAQAVIAAIITACTASTRHASTVDDSVFQTHDRGKSSTEDFKKYLER